MATHRTLIEELVQKADTMLNLTTEFSKDYSKLYIFNNTPGRRRTRALSADASRDEIVAAMEWTAKS